MADSPHTTALSRRLFLAAGSVGAVFGALGAAAAAQTMAAPAAVDAGLFALVSEGDRHFAEIEVYSGLCDEVAAEKDGRQILAEHEKALSKAHEGYSATFEAAMQCVPASVAGVRAKLEWIGRKAEYMEVPDELWMALLHSLLASPALSIATN